MKLPLNCDAHYHSQFMSRSQSRAMYDWLTSHFDLTQPELMQMPDGNEVKICPWRMIFLDPKLEQSQLFPLYHGRRAIWFPLLSQLQQQIAELTGVEFSVAVCLYYPDGAESLSFHSDLPAFGPTDIIASISLGAEREFLIRSANNSKDQHSVTLENGSLLIMGQGFQDMYQHALASAENVTSPRFNISFRQFFWPKK
ncbi:alpha-ketoglutarate-dependent dioxygenase AlkB [Pseudoalteromonas ostreae]|uniref:alpha-ketoglutarate-dependent dioxygenase AlkB n=1 Tax=Pseudoalteromonas ostreae TaxID=2774154 RepID=UPI001B36E6E3|nr:alpha-ketoglutarate-dependent dioxygenase AlkB [Pseudoalteromonas ostreae]